MRYIRSALVFLVVILLLVGFIFWNNCALQTENFDVRLKKLPNSFQGLRIAVLADLHGREFGKNNRELLRHLQKSAPDLICIDGDLLDEAEDIGMVKPLIEGLCAIAPTFYVTGNHEWQLENPQSILSQIDAFGATVLRNEYVVLHRKEEKLIIAGVDDPCGPYDQKSPEQLMNEIYEAEGKNACVIMLAHRNDSISMWSQLGTDLVLTGHCHGGVVRLPLVGGVFGTHRELFPAYDAGLYEKNDTQLFVSRGLGYTNVRLRLFNRPQIAILTLYPSG